MTDTLLTLRGDAPERSVGASPRKKFSPSTSIKAGVSSKLPDPEVPEKPTRRRFTAEYKLRILREANRCINSGELGALLRREGLYSSNLTTWKKQQGKGILHALTPKKRGRKAHKINPLTRRVTELERENKQLSQRLNRAEIIIDAQKKISQLLGTPLDVPEKGESK